MHKKIVTKTISNRIKKYISHIIENSQTGFIKGRYIGENIRLIQETKEALEEEYHPGLILFADFEKAFDSISNDFMFNCLKCFNFGTDIIRWINCFYNDVKSSVTNSGYMTEFFHIKRGLRQGCPLSAYLFIICIELLAAAVRENKNIGGISLFGNDFKSSMFADDATFALDGTFNSFRGLIDVLEAFKSVSGLKLNNKKNTVLRIGSLRNATVEYLKHLNFLWTSESAKTLGIVFFAESKIMQEQNLYPKQNDFTNCLKRWQHRKLTLMGKITVIKTFALPKLIYPFTVL